ncbi:MAG: DUF262 domain-containing protein [Candidatus Pacearchaeota archaeon]|jgi:hypothetical protein|nr:DUF262 domain-containing protein [Clostridia bacterium]
MKLSDFKKELPIKIQKGMHYGWLKELVNPRYNHKFDFDIFLPTKGKNLQRPFCWTIEQKRELITSVLMGRDIPHFTIIISEFEDRTKVYKVMDGKQRLSTLIGFVKDEFTFAFEGKEYLFSEMPEEIQKHVMSFHIHFDQAYEYWDDLISDDNKIAWFEQINFAGTPQDVEHLNNLKK